MTSPSLPENADPQGNGEISSSSSEATTPPRTPTTIDIEEATDIFSKARTLARPAWNTFDRYIDSYRGSGSGWGTVALRMVPDRNAPDYRAAEWAACLTIRCEHVARLMDEGLHWSADNLLPEEGSMCHSLNKTWTAKGFRHARVWGLADKAPDRTTPRWVARLEIVSPFLDVLAAFRLLDLSPANVCSANAWDPQQKLVYSYNCRTPGMNYNCIHDDKPLSGWWPWPKKGMPTAEDPNTLAALMVAARSSGEGDELFPCLAVKPVVCAPRLPQPWSSQGELEAYRQRLNQYRESLVRYQASLGADNMWFERAGGVVGGCVIP